MTTTDPMAKWGYVQFDANTQLDERGHRVRQSSPWDALEGMYIPESDGRPGMVMLHGGAVSSCGMCGEHVSYEMRADGVLQPKFDCVWPDGEDTVIELDVPSGRIVVDDDLRDVYDVDDDALTPSINARLGVKLLIEATAKAGCATGLVGNTCPSLYRTGQDTYAIANAAGEDDDEWEKSERSIGQPLASVCTDLWWYSICDYDDYIARGGTTEMSWTRTVVAVPAGRYRFTNRMTTRAWDRDAPGVIVYADIQKIA